MINSNVVIILPYNRNKILMQLRDTNKGVVFGVLPNSKFRRISPPDFTAKYGQTI